MENSTATALSASEHLLFIVGNYGSGKTELAVNLAFRYRELGRRVTLADLDVVNPYFRCREPREILRRSGIRVVVPPEQHQFTDLPIVVPEIKGMIEGDAGEDHISIFDVGGDDVGATVLASFTEALGNRAYDLVQVINGKRPFTDSVDGCLKMKRDIEQRSGMRVTGLISNTHLMDETTAEVVLEGYELTRLVAQAAQVPIAFVSVLNDLVEASALQRISSPILFMNRIMLPPWLQGAQKKDSPTSVGGSNDGDSEAADQGLKS